MFALFNKEAEVDVVYFNLGSGDTRIMIQGLNKGTELEVVRVLGKRVSMAAPKPGFMIARSRVGGILRLVEPNIPTFILEGELKV